MDRIGVAPVQIALDDDVSASRSAPSAAPLAPSVALAVLAGVLLFVAWNMGEGISSAVF